MRSPAYHWIEGDGRALLRFNFRMVASVKPAGDRYMVAISWQGREHGGLVGSLDQGRRYVERWVDARKGFPTRRGDPG